MNEADWLAERFEEHRPHLRTIAYRMLGSSNESEDAVQEAWLRLSRADTSEVANLGGWLTTVTGRVSKFAVEFAAVSLRIATIAARSPSRAGSTSTAPVTPAAPAGSPGRRRARGRSSPGPSRTVW